MVENKDKPEKVKQDDKDSKEEIRKQRELAKLRGDIKDDNVEKFKEAQKLIATRDRLERDYKEDVLKVTFKTSTETYRTIESRKPTNKEMSIILSLAASALKAQASNTPEDLLKLKEVFTLIAGIAASLAVDKTLDQEFWDNNVGSDTLSNFVNGIVIATQRGSGVSPDEMKKFRK